MMKKGFTHESTYNESKEWYTPKYLSILVIQCHHF